MQEHDILRIINSLVEKVNALAIALNTNEYNEESEDEYNEQLNKQWLVNLPFMNRLQ